MFHLGLYPILIIPFPFGLHHFRVMAAITNARDRNEAFQLKIVVKHAFQGDNRKKIQQDTIFLCNMKYMHQCCFAQKYHGLWGTYLCSDNKDIVKEKQFEKHLVILIFIIFHCCVVQRVESIHSPFVYKLLTNGQSPNYLLNIWRQD